MVLKEPDQHGARDADARQNYGEHKVTTRVNDLGNLSQPRPAKQNVSPAGVTDFEGSRDMFGFSPTVIIVVAVLAVMAVLLLTPLGRPRRTNPMRRKKS